jgi:predicted permease
MPDDRPASSPRWQQAVDRRLAGLGVPPLRRVEIIDEIAQHVEDRYDELKGEGRSDDEAGRLALADLEGPRLAREVARIERMPALNAPVLGTPRRSFMGNLSQDVRYALRSMRQGPVFSAIVIGTLALTIGANVAIFSVTDTAMLRPFSYPQIDRMVALNEQTRAGQQLSVSWPDFQDWGGQNQVFEHLGIYRSAPVNLTSGGEPERVNGAIASSGVFGAAGITPAMGRSLQPADDRAGAARVAVLSDRIWRTRFNADRGILGRAIVIDGEPHTVVGVMPSGMRFPSRLTDVWLPLGPAIETFPPRGAHPGLFGIGRLKAGVSFDRAQADMDIVARRIESQFPDSNTGVAVSMTPYYEQIVANIRPTLFVLLGAVGFVLLIGCANLANLMLARAERRQHEIALRAALGAGRRRIIQQLSTESLLLSLIGGALGVLLAWWMISLLAASRPTTIPRIDQLAIDRRVLAFSTLLSILTGVLFGLAPAIRGSSMDLATTLGQAGRGAGLGRSRRLRSALVVAEVALAMTLLVGAGLMTRSFAKLTAIDPGFDPENVVTMQVTLPPAKYADRARWTTFHDELVRRVAAIPGVAAAGLNSALPLGGRGAESPVIAEGQELPLRGAPGTVCLFQATTPDYLKAMSVALLKGRFFTAHDTSTSARVAIVDDALVKKLFGDANPIGKRIAFEITGMHDRPEPIWREVVGVVRHVRHYGLTSEPPFVQVYAPFDQLPTWFDQRRPVMSIVARTTLPVDAIAGSVRREVAAIDPDIPVYGVQTMEQYVRQTMEQPRLSVVLLGGFGALALLLALMGIYGVVSYSVASRTQEIGIRMALGATRQRVLRLVLGHALALVVTGVVLGVGAALALTSMLRNLLYQVSDRDPATFVAIAVALVAVGILASAVPARRATRVDPIEALRVQ